jgi:hypothetical protein
MGYNKDDAFAFFIALESALNHSLPNPSAMKKEMLNICNEGASEHRIRENQFLYHFVMPLIHKQMQTVPGIGPGEARHALLCEYHAKISDISSGNAMRRAGSPFGKAIGRPVQQIMSDWTKDNRSFPLNQAYPDIAIRDPFPHRIVFDAKYFDSDSSAAATKSLVEGIYEAGHYRGLPKVPPLSAEKPGWDYEFGCLLAYDASDDGVLTAAWNTVTNKQAFWDGGNVFVMIVRGTRSPY